MQQQQYLEQSSKIVITNQDVNYLYQFEKQEIGLVIVQTDNKESSMNLCTFNSDGLQSLQSIQDFIIQQNFDILCLQEHQNQYDGQSTNLRKYLQNYGEKLLNKYQIFADCCVNRDYAGTLIAIKKNINNAQVQYFKVHESDSIYYDRFIQNYLKNGRVQFALYQSQNANLLVVNIYQQFLNKYGSNLYTMFSKDEYQEIFCNLYNAFCQQLKQLQQQQNIKDTSESIVNILKQYKCCTQYNYDQISDSIVFQLYEKLSKQQIINLFELQLDKYIRYIANDIIEIMKLRIMGNFIANIYDQRNRQQQIKQIQNVVYDTINIHLLWMQDNCINNLIYFISDILLQGIDTVLQNREYIYHKHKIEIIKFLDQDCKNELTIQIQKYFQEYYQKYFSQQDDKQQKDIYKKFSQVFINILLNEQFIIQYNIQIKKVFNIISKIIKQIQQKYNCNVIICGDFNQKDINVTPDQNNLQEFKQLLNLSNCYNISNKQWVDLYDNDYKIADSVKQTRTNKINNLIDHIFIDGNKIKVAKWTLFNSFAEQIKDDCEFKDHDPISVILQFEQIPQVKQSYQIVEQYDDFVDGWGNLLPDSVFPLKYINGSLHQLIYGQWQRVNVIWEYGKKVYLVQDENRYKAHHYNMYIFDKNNKRW